MLRILFCVLSPQYFLSLYLYLRNCVLILVLILCSNFLCVMSLYLQPKLLFSCIKLFARFTPSLVFIVPNLVFFLSIVKAQLIFYIVLILLISQINLKPSTFLLILYYIKFYQVTFNFCYQVSQVIVSSANLLFYLMFCILHINL